MTELEELNSIKESFEGKGKGAFFKLPIDTRQRYKFLKDKYEGVQAQMKANAEVSPGPSVETHPQASLGETEGEVTISRAEFDSLKKMVQGLKGSERSLQKTLGLGTFQEVAEKEERTHTAVLRLYRTNTNDPHDLIVAFNHLRFDYDEETRKHDKDIYELILLSDDGTTSTTEMPLIMFPSLNDFETVEIVESTTKELAKNMGKQPRPKTRGGYTMNYLGDSSDGRWEDFYSGTFDLLETTTQTTCLVQRPSGQTFLIDAKYLNQC